MRSAALRGEELRIVMLTDDNIMTVDTVATAVGGIDDLRGGLGGGGRRMRIATGTDVAIESAS